MFEFLKQNKQQNIISSSMRPYIEIKASQSSNLLLWQSKFCGLPYLPEKNVYPRNSHGKYLYMIAQINFEELSRLEPYPEKGILQFWIEDDDLYGMNFNDQTKQDSFKVVYYSEVQLMCQQFSGQKFKQLF